MIIQYVRKGKARIKKGVMVAIPDEEDNKIRFGYTLCCFKKDKKKVDEFDVGFGKGVAIDRAMIDGRPLVIPFSMAKQFARFVERCKKYYKQIDSNSSNQQEIIYKEQEEPPPVVA